MFKAYYDKKRRFKFIHDDLKKIKFIKYHGKEKLRKTGCFYGDSMNFYIDTSDGINEDIAIPEYCARIMKIIEECNGKPFLFFKAAYSPIYTKNIIQLAADNNGTVIPFFKWSFNDNFYKYLLPNRKKLIKKKNSIEKSIDIGFAANLKHYTFPKPDKENPLVSWKDKELFEIGSGEDTGYYQIKTRQNNYDQLSQSRFSFFHTHKITYQEYIDKTFSWRVCLNPSGMGEYTSRMFDHTFLGQCVVLRKTSYDFGNSWKSHLPEVDFQSEDWEKELQAVLDNHLEWSEKCADYFEKFWSAHAIVNYLSQSIDKYHP